MIRELWNQQGLAARAGLIAGIAAILVGMTWAGLHLLRPQYQVLFSGLDARDASLMVAELEKLKVPYRLGEGGSALLVPQDQVPSTRMKLMGKELPLQGAVGLELFNHSDFGVTEFAQKVNYQRALQGEITRTILSIAQVRAARVHLVLPEQGLFKKAGTRPKASIVLTLRDGETLRPEQVNGMQRLVSSAIPDIAMQDVTIVNQQGIALSRAEEPGAEGLGGSSSRLDVKRLTEDYLSRKATAVLEQAFGAGQVMASADVSLNLDQVKVTTEDPVPARTDKPGAAHGVIVRERETRRSAATTAPDASRGENSANPVTLREVDYQVGRRVEQVISAPGAVRRLTMAVVVRRALDGAQTERVRELVATAVGFAKERGDSVVVYSIDQVAGAGQPKIPGFPEEPLAASANGNGSAGVAGAKNLLARNGTAGPAKVDPATQDWLAWLLGALALAAFGALIYGAWDGVAKRAGLSPRGTRSLTETEREALLRDMRSWLNSPQAAGVAPSGGTGVA